MEDQNKIEQKIINASKDSYYINGKRKFFDFLIGFIGIMMVFNLGIVFSTSILFSFVGTVSAVILSVFFLKMGRKFIAIGIILMAIISFFFPSAPSIDETRNCEKETRILVEDTLGGILSNIESYTSHFNVKERKCLVLIYTSSNNKDTVDFGQALYDVSKNLKIASYSSPSFAFRQALHGVYGDYGIEFFSSSPPSSLCEINGITGCTFIKFKNFIYSKFEDKNILLENR